jgi:hypothetical protein
LNDDRGVFRDKLPEQLLRARIGNLCLDSFKKSPRGAEKITLTLEAHA